MELDDPKFLHLTELLGDYSDFIWKHAGLRDSLMYYLGRAIKTGQDITDEELLAFENYLKSEIDYMVKTTAN